jgi:hypothetical protein
LPKQHKLQRNNNYTSPQTSRLKFHAEGEVIKNLYADWRQKVFNRVSGIILLTGGEVKVKFNEKFSRKTNNRMMTNENLTARRLNTNRAAKYLFLSSEFARKSIISGF